MDKGREETGEGIRILVGIHRGIMEGKGKRRGKRVSGGRDIVRAG